MLTQQQIKEFFDYQDGMLYWKNGRSGIKTDGSEAGCIHHTGYRVITVNSKSYKVHRLIWVMFNGDIPNGLLVDHVDRNISNNKIENLRLLTKSMNARNRGAKGVYYDASRNKWVAQASVNNTNVALGRFDTREAAEAEYKSFYEFMLARDKSSELV